MNPFQKPIKPTHCDICEQPVPHYGLALDAYTGLYYCKDCDGPMWRATGVLRDAVKKGFFTHPARKSPV